MRLEEVEVPAPGPGQVLVRVAAAGVNYADLRQREGTYLTATQVPTTLGFEAAGTVEALGPGVTEPGLGTRVVAPAQGAYADYALAYAAASVPLPDGLDFRRATALYVQGLTAYQILRMSARLQPGESVLVHAAAGGVGSLAVQLARLMGAGAVIGTASTAEKRALARRLGADVAIDYTDDTWVERVKEATDGQGVDIVLEMVGGRIARQGLECLKPFSGRMVVYGSATGEPIEFNGRQLMDRNVGVVGYWLAPLLRFPDRIATDARELVQYVADGKLEIVVGESFPLAQAAEAHRAMAERRTSGKVVLLP